MSKRQRARHPGIRRRPGGRWQVHSAGGRRAYKTFGSLDEALRWQAAQRLEANPTAAGAVLSVREAIRQYLESFPVPAAGDRRGAKRWQTTQRQCGWWVERIGHLGLAQLTPQTIRQALALLVDVSPATRNRYHAALSSACRWMVEDRGWLEINPARGLKRAAERPPSPRVYSHDEVTRLLDACRRSTQWRLYPMVSLAYRMLLRRSELLNLRWSQIDFAGRMLRLEAGEQKSGRPSTTPIPPGAMEILEELRSTRRRTDTDLVFARADGRRAEVPRKALHAAYREAKIETVRQPWHSLRHTGASHYILAGGNPAKLQWLLRHSSPAMTSRYVTLAAEHLTGELDRLETGILLGP